MSPKVRLLTSLTYMSPKISILLSYLFMLIHAYYLPDTPVTKYQNEIRLITKEMQCRRVRCFVTKNTYINHISKYMHHATMKYVWIGQISSLAS